MIKKTIAGQFWLTEMCKKCSVLQKFKKSYNEAKIKLTEA